MKINDVILETHPTSTKIVATKGGRPLNIKFDKLPHPVQYHHINQEIKMKIPQIGEVERMNLSRELAKNGVANVNGVEFRVQAERPREMEGTHFVETASAGASSAGGIATVAGALPMQKRNADGTAKNALDQDSLFGVTKKKSTKKKS